MSSRIPSRSRQAPPPTPRSRPTAQTLPFSYGIEALVAQLTQNTSITDLTSTLLPLLGLAIALLVIGIVMLRYLEHAVRQIGSLGIA